MRSNTILDWPIQSDVLQDLSVGTLEIHDLTAQASENEAFDDHLIVIRGTCKSTGLDALIALHNTTLGPAIGGCRVWKYACQDDAIRDVLRLSAGMSYKAAMAGLPLGGGKAVINCDPHTEKTEDMLHSFGIFIDCLDGAYITAQDVGTSVADMDIISNATNHVLGRTGDPSESTAYGVLVGMQAAIRHLFDTSSLLGVTVAVQGLGKVGMSLCQQVYNQGARLIVTDINSNLVKQAIEKYDALVSTPEEIVKIPADIFSPCAMGGIINHKTIPMIKASIIAGAANNQLLSPDDGKALFDAGILYAPDYVINSGGLINAYLQMPGASDDISLSDRLINIGKSLSEIFQASKKEGSPTNIIADRQAKGEINIARYGSSLME